MAILGQNITASPDHVVALGTRSDQPIDYSEFSQDDLNGFVEGVHHLMENHDKKEWLSLFQSMQDEEIENMTPGEALSTFSIMHNPVMEEIASRFNKDAMAFANDVSINLAQIERLQQNAMAVRGAGYLIEKDDLPADKKAQEEDKEKSNDVWEILLELHEERMEEQREALKKEQEDFLRSQHITSSDGKKLSVLDIVRAMDKMLDNWDDSFDEMVTQGIAKPEDKDRLYKNLTKYRNMMADPNLSEQEKQKLREQMIRDGLLTQEQMDYADKKAQYEQEARGSKIDANQVDHAKATETEVSVTKRIESLVEKENTTTIGGFSTSIPSGIKANVTPTESFNAKASEVIVEDQKPEIKPVVANAAPALSAFS